MPHAGCSRPVESSVGYAEVTLGLAEVELAAGHSDAAEAAAERALKTNPQDTEAMVKAETSVYLVRDRVGNETSSVQASRTFTS